MKNRFIGLLLLSTLFMSLTSIALVSAETSGKVIVHLKGALEADDNLKAETQWREKERPLNPAAQVWEFHVCHVLKAEEEQQP